MTKAQYKRAYAAVRKRGSVLKARAMRELKRAYKTAADQVAEVVRDAKARSLSELTIQARESIERQLEIGANIIRSKASDVIPKTIRQGTAAVTSIDAEYLEDLMPLYSDINKTGIRAVAALVNERVVISIVNRIFEDGYTLSDRVWRVGTDYRNQINSVISAGFAQGRDPVKIARDIQYYVRDGKTRLAQRYGPNLTRGTREWMQRIRKDVDYRALRLVRSELYMSFQQAALESGRANPGAEDWYDWILDPGRQDWGCECPDNAASGPYHYQDVPDYPHANCNCRVQPRLMDREQFISDLKSWTDGARVDYLDDWYNQYYLPANP
jgi:hypothetical protein